eukprot:5899996-Heterocapsa_arctica.AAC.1
MDANARVGYGQKGQRSPAIGPFRAEQESWSGERLRHLCEDHQIILANTWHPQSSMATWSSGTGLFSRIDYIAIKRRDAISI